MRHITVGLLVGLVATTGCAELHERALGTRVHTVTIKGVEYVHCSVTIDRTKPQLAHDSIEVCRAAVEAAPEMRK